MPLWRLAMDGASGACRTLCTTSLAETRGLVPIASDWIALPELIGLTFVPAGCNAPDAWDVYVCCWIARLLRLFDLRCSIWMLAARLWPFSLLGVGFEQQRPVHRPSERWLLAVLDLPL
jgi:hypothetical protein